MRILPVTHPDFARYGRLVVGYDFTPLLELLRQNTPRPAGGTLYVPQDETMEALPVARQLGNHLYGGMPVQIGYCNGTNHALNCLEYHRGSEVNVAADDIVLLLAPLQKMQAGRLDTREVQAFAVPAGAAVLLYETTLHYAPCNAAGSDGFRVIVVLPRGTNTERPEITPDGWEDQLLWGRNKWLSAHPKAPEAQQGAFVGLTGENIQV